MKNPLIIIALSTLIATSLNAQKYYVPYDTWPYVYEEFSQGTIAPAKTADGEKSLYNICVLDGALHYVQDDVIMVAEMQNIRKVEISGDVYANLAGKMYKILSETADGSVLELTLFNPDSMEKSSIGYGVSSAVAKTQNASNIMGIRSETMNKSIMDATIEKFGGKPIPVDQKFYLYVSGKLYNASRSELLRAGVDKTALDKFAKENKIKWKQTESLEKLVSFLKAQAK